MSETDDPTSKPTSRNVAKKAAGRTVGNGRDSTSPSPGKDVSLGKPSVPDLVLRDIEPFIGQLVQMRTDWTGSLGENERLASVVDELCGLRARIPGMDQSSMAESATTDKARNNIPVKSDGHEEFKQQRDSALKEASEAREKGLEAIEKNLLTHERHVRHFCYLFIAVITVFGGIVVWNHHANMLETRTKVELHATQAEVFHKRAQAAADGLNFLKQDFDIYNSYIPEFFLTFAHNRFSTSRDAAALCQRMLGRLRSEGRLSPSLEASLLELQARSALDLNDFDLAAQCIDDLARMKEPDRTGRTELVAFLRGRAAFLRSCLLISDTPKGTPRSKQAWRNGFDKAGKLLENADTEAEYEALRLMVWSDLFLGNGVVQDRIPTLRRLAQKGEQEAKLDALLICDIVFPISHGGRPDDKLLASEEFELARNTQVESRRLIHLYIEAECQGAKLLEEVMNRK